jgi:putative transposase
MMKKYSQRKSPRLKDYDYAQEGAYFVTICTHRREHLFGDVVGDSVVLNDVGMVVAQEWERTAQLRPYVSLDLYVVMPNHFHGILVINHEIVGTTRRVVRDEENVVCNEVIPSMQGNGEKRTFQRNVPTLQSGSLGAIIGQFKSQVTRRVWKETPIIHGERIWQSRYHDHIIRNESDLNRLREYVVHNPGRWEEDTFYTG